MYRTGIPLVFSLLLSPASYAQKKTGISSNRVIKEQARQDIEKLSEDYKKIALAIWDFAELGYKEIKSSALLQQTLNENGFTVEAGVAEIPTAFVATYGNGKPVIGILAEFDALPGLSQQVLPEKKPIPGKDAGHGCGHHLFGTASIAAGMAIKKLINEKKAVRNYQSIWNSG